MGDEGSRMTRWLVFGPVVVALAGVVFGISRAPTASATKHGCGFASLPRATSVGEQSLYGHIRSLVRKGRRFELRLDPAWLLTGATAARAALEDTGSSDVPNDTYTREESHKLLTYRVAANTPVTVLKNTTCSTHVTVASLARSGRPAGFWLRVRGDSVRAIDQQYHP
jgi:hypothetical protein